MKRNEDSIINETRGSLKSTAVPGGIEAGVANGQEKKLLHYSCLTPGTLIRMKGRAGTLFPELLKEEEMIAVLNDEARRNWFDSARKTLMTPKAGGNIGKGDSPLIGSMHFIPALCNGELTNLVVWTWDDGYELVCSPPDVP